MEEAESPFLPLRDILPPERGAPLSVQFSSPALKRIKKSVNIYPACAYTRGDPSSKNEPYYQRKIVPINYLFTFSSFSNPYRWIGVLYYCTTRGPSAKEKATIGGKRRLSDPVQALRRRSVSG
jgi:hypothetical protein